MHTYVGTTFYGTSYASYGIAYNAANQAVAETFYDASGNAAASVTWAYNPDGSLAEVTGNGISGQPYTATDTLYANGTPSSETWTNSSSLYQTKTWTANGYDVHTYVGTTFAGTHYASYDNAYTSSGFRDLETFYDASGNVLAMEEFRTNGTQTVFVASTPVTDSACWKSRGPRTKAWRLWQAHPPR